MLIFILNNHCHLTFSINTDHHIYYSFFVSSNAFNKYWQDGERGNEMFCSISFWTIIAILRFQLIFNQHHFCYFPLYLAMLLTNTGRVEILGMKCCAQFHFEQSLPFYIFNQYSTFTIFFVSSNAFNKYWQDGEIGNEMLCSISFWTIIAILHFQSIHNITFTIFFCI